MAGAGFTSVDSDGGTNNIKLTSVSGSVALGSGALSGSTGPAFLVGDGGTTNNAGGTAAITYGGSITSTGTARAVDIQDRAAGAGDITLSGTISHATGNASTIFLDQDAAGTITFSGANSVANSGTATAINLTNNTGATINFTGGGLNIDTTSGVGFNASGGGTVSVQGTGNTINSTTGTALNITNTTIGANDVTFQSVSANGATSGIILNTTGALGGLTVTGTDGVDAGTAPDAGTGGTIQNTLGDGISLTSTRDVSLGGMTIVNAAGHGINASNLAGTNALTTVTVQDFDSGSTSARNGFSVVNNNTNLTSLTITGSTFNGSAGSKDGLFVEAQGTSSMTLSVQDSSFTDMAGNAIALNSITGSNGLVRLTVANSSFTNAVATSGKGGISLNASGDLTLLADINNNTLTGIMHPASPFGAIDVVNGSTADADVTIRNNTLNNLDGGQGIAIFADGGTADLLIQNNSVDNLGSTTKSAIVVDYTNNPGLNTTATGNVTISNNAIGQHGQTAGNLWTTGDGIGNGVLVQARSGATVTSAITGNVISANTASGIEVVRVAAFDSGATVNATVTGNTIQDTSTTHDEFDASAGTSILTGTVNLSISNNTLPSFGAGTIHLAEGLPGTLNVTQSSASAVSASNSSSTVLVSGSPSFGAQSPSQPSTPNLPLLAAADGIASASDAHVQSEEANALDGAAPDTTPSLAGSQVSAQGTIEAHLTQAELNDIVTAAAARWEQSGISTAQLAVLHEMHFTVADLPAWYLGAYAPGGVTLDANASGYGWYLDQTPGDDSEFGTAATATRLVTDPSGAPAGHIDLLTTVMHEMGHALGLADDYAASGRDDLMYGFLVTGERRLPGAGEAHDAVAGSIKSDEYQISTINLGTINAGDSVTIQWRSTLNTQSNQLIVNPSNQGTVSSTNAGGASTNASVATLDTLTLGDRVFVDGNHNLAYDSGEGVDGVALTLFADTNNSGGFDGGDTQIATTITAGSGAYQFTGLAPGNYIVRADAGNFAGGQPLFNRTPISAGVDPDNNIDSDNNGLTSGGAAVSQAITLSYNNEVIPGTGNDSNASLDFGFSDSAPTNITGTLAINEFATFGSAVGTATAVDADDTTGFTWSFAAGGDAGGRFAINPVTGAIGVANGLLLDFEQNSSHSVTVHVVDKWGAAIAADKVLTVTVNNVDAEILAGDNTANTFVGGPLADTLLGLGNNDTLSGGGGDDTLDGGTGSDLLIGGTGNDLYLVDSSFDQIIENPNEGTDTVNTTASYVLGANLENLTLLGAGNLQGIGNNLTNLITGNENDNVLNGMAGADGMAGMGGNDTYFVDNSFDVVAEVEGLGIDTVYSTVTYVLGIYVENLYLQGNAIIGGYGNALSNLIVGNSADNNLDGMGGADGMSGGAGNDIYFVDNAFDVVAENSGEGTMDAVYSSQTYVLGANVEFLYLTGASNISGFGNADANVIQGNSGDNVLNGRQGRDTLVGNAGNDTFQFNIGEAHGDIVFDFAGNGAAAGDSLQFVNYGAGATFTQIDGTQWQINYNGGTQHEVITFSSPVVIDPTDYAFVTI